MVADLDNLTFFAYEPNMLNNAQGYYNSLVNDKSLLNTLKKSDSGKFFTYSVDGILKLDTILAQKNFTRRFYDFSAVSIYFTKIQLMARLIRIGAPTNKKLADEYRNCIFRLNMLQSKKQKYFHKHAQINMSHRQLELELAHSTEKNKALAMDALNDLKVKSNEAIDHELAKRSAKLGSSKGFKFLSQACKEQPETKRYVNLFIEQAIAINPTDRGFSNMSPRAVASDARAS